MTEAASIPQVVLEKLQQLPLEKQREVLAFVTALGQENEMPPPPLSLQQLRALPIEERDQQLAPYIALMAEDFLADPELTEFCVLDGDGWKLEDE